MPNSTKKSRKALAELVYLLFFLIIIFVVYGLTEQPIQLGEELKQIELKALLTPKEAPKMIQNDNTSIDSFKLDTTTAVKMDSTSKYILLTGDSMVEELLHRVKKIAKYNGHELMTCIWYNSTTTKWSKDNRLTNLCKEYKPEIILFTLGANELLFPNLKSCEENIKSIMAEVDHLNIPIVWIGPPSWVDDMRLISIIDKHVGKGRLYHSEVLRKQLVGLRKSDGAHPSRKGANLWADSLSTWIVNKSHLKNKLLFNLPELATYEARPYIPTDSTICRRSTRSNVRILEKEFNPNPCTTASKN